MESNLIKVSRLLYFYSKDTESAFAEPTCTDKGFSLFELTNCRAREVNFNSLAWHTFKFYLTFPILYCTRWNFVAMLLRLSHETHCRWEALLEQSRRNKRYTTSPCTCVQFLRKRIKSEAQLDSRKRLSHARASTWFKHSLHWPAMIWFLCTVVIVLLFLENKEAQKPHKRRIKNRFGTSRFLFRLFGFAGFIARLQGCCFSWVSLSRCSMRTKGTLAR